MPGTLWVNVTLRDGLTGAPQPLLQRPLRIPYSSSVVFPGNGGGAVDGPASKITGAGAAAVVAGASSSFLVFPRDVFGNRLLPSSGDSSGGGGGGTDADALASRLSVSFTPSIIGGTTFAVDPPTALSDGSGRIRVSYVAPRPTGSESYTVQMRVVFAADEPGGPEVLVGGAPRTLTVYSSLLTLQGSQSALVDAQGELMSSYVAAAGSATGVWALAGHPQELFVQFRDRNGVDIPAGSSQLNGLVVTIKPATTLVPIPLVQRTPSNAYQLVINTTVAGQFALHLTITVPQAGETNLVANVQVYPGDLSLPRSSLTTNSQPVAGLATTVFQLAARDSLGNLRTAAFFGDGFRARLLQADGSETEASLRVLADGTYAGIIRPTITGAASLQVQGVAGVSLVGPPGMPSLTVSHSAFSASSSTLSPSPDALASVNHTAGVPVEFGVFARDLYGNLYTRPDLALSVVATLLAPQPQGTVAVGSSYSVTGAVVAATVSEFPFTASFVVTVAGSYSVSVLERVTGTLVSGTPFALTVTPASVTAAMTSVEGSALVGRAVSSSEAEARTFSITLRDAYGNNAVASRPANPRVTVTVDVREDFIPLLDGADSVQTVAVAGPTLNDAGSALVYAFAAKWPGLYRINLALGTETIPGSPFRVAIVPLEAPRMLAARLSPSLGSILVSFDRPTDGGGLGYGIDDCTLVLSDDTMNLLGESPACRWNDRLDVLEVVFGRGATLLPTTGTHLADKLTLRRSALRAAGRGSLPSTGDVPVTVGSVAPFPRAVLTAPTLVGVCGSFTLDMRDSTGGGGRPLTFRVDVDSVQVTAALQDKLKRQRPGASTFELASADLAIGATYKFMARVTNWVGASSETSVSIMRAPVPVPSVVIQGPSSRQVSASAALTLEARAWLPPLDCVGDAAVVADAIEDAALVFAWSQASGPPLDFSSESLARTLSSPTLSIQPGSLQPGASYAFVVTVQVNEGRSLPASSRVTVQVLVDPINVVGSLGPDVRTWPAGQPLVLTARPTDAGSYSSTDYLWSYEWRCLMLADDTDATSLLDTATDALLLSYVTPLCFAGADATLAAAQDTLAVPGGAAGLSAGWYLFLMRACREPILAGRCQLARVLVVVGSEQVLPVTVADVPVRLTRGKHLPNQALILSCSAATGTSATNAVTYRWSATRGQLPPGGLSAVVDTSYGALTTSAATLVIRPGTLLAGQTYGFQCDAQEGGMTGFAQVKITVNSPPLGGLLSITLPGSASSAVEGVTSVELAATGWVDEDLPLSYTFSYLLDGQESLLSTPRAAHALTAVLPAGILTFRVTITDALGAATTYTHLDPLLVVPLDVELLLTGGGRQRRRARSRSSQRRQRSLLQEEVDPAVEEEIATMMLATVFEPAVATMDLNAALVFTDMWGRRFGGQQSAAAGVRCQEQTASLRMTEMKVGTITLQDDRDEGGQMYMVTEMRVGKLILCLVTLGEVILAAMKNY
eukprot:jgi/Mesvir1/11829/Mv26028-RA.2